MKLISILLFFFVSIPLIADEKVQTLRVLCYNVHWCKGMDGKYDVPRLAEVIKKYNPDLVALQEVDVKIRRSGIVHQAQELSRLTGLEVRFGPTQHYEGGLFGNAVLTNLPILDVEIQPLPYTEATEEKVTYPRAAICVTVKAKDGKPLKFISTHFQHNVEEDRVAEAREINKLFVTKDDIPAILAGDMNATPDAEPVLELLKEWKNAINDPPAPTAPSNNPRSRIDYIFYRSKSKLTLKKTEVINEAMASDHCPVFAIFEYKGS